MTVNRDIELRLSRLERAALSGRGEKTVRDNETEKERAKMLARLEGIETSIASLTAAVTELDARIKALEGPR